MSGVQVAIYSSEPGCWCLGAFKSIQSCSFKTVPELRNILFSIPKIVMRIIITPVN